MTPLNNTRTATPAPRSKTVGRYPSSGLTHPKARLDTGAAASPWSSLSRGRFWPRAARWARTAARNSSVGKAAVSLLRRLRSAASAAGARASSPSLLLGAHTDSPEVLPHAKRREVAAQAGGTACRHRLISLGGIPPNGKVPL